MIKQRINSLRTQMVKEAIDAYIIPTSDFHQSEYVGDHFKARNYMSGFTGSAGTLVVTQEEAGLFTDGRYFIQAEKELENTGITLYKMGEEGVPDLESFLAEKIKEKGTLGFDGRVISAYLGKQLETKLKSKQIQMVYEKDLVDLIWEDRPELSSKPAFLLDIKYCGKTASNKLKELRESMKAKNATVHILTSLDDIAWLFNLRGHDIECNPVVLAYALITQQTAYLFVNPKTIDETVRKQLEADGVELKVYHEIYDEVKGLEIKESVLLDPQKVNYMIYRYLDQAIQKIEESNPTTFSKSIKNEVELMNLRNSHIKDGVAFTKFMYWLKTNIGKMKITEISASDYLEAQRRAREDFIELSFPTIAAYKEHAAMMHYSATPESDVELKTEGMLLVDSGGQYFDGTTDITRTMVLGEISETLKEHFTAVVRGMLNLSQAKFLYGCRGMNLDILARGPIWDLDIDYKCGTGHGVGFLLNVHEAPNGFRWKLVPERNDSCVLEEGMVTTDEPGIYIEGSHGIRIENELVCQKSEKNEYGQFMSFETITYAPIDLDGIDAKYMSSKEIKALNNYHQMVYEKISPFLTEEEKEWLKIYTRAI